MPKPQFPVNYITITREFMGDAHKGIDLGWNSNYGGANQPIVCPIDMTIVTNSYANDAGNFVVAKAYWSDTEDLLMRFLHLKDKPSYYVGQTVKQSVPFAYMGNTGDTIGNHLHFETWLVPKNYKYAFTDVLKYMKDPIMMVYAYDGQIISDKSLLQPQKYVPIKYYGTPIDKDSSKQQIEININNLRARSAPNGNILGYVNKGIYNVLETVTNGDYLWCRVEDNLWVAYSNEWSIIYEKEVPDEQPNDNEQNDNVINKQNFLIRIITFFINMIIKLFKGGK